MQGGTLVAGLLWCNNNRAAKDMPAYGKYGGRNWNAGRNPLDPEDPGADDDTPVDDMDEAFARHDYNYTIMSEREADMILVLDLLALPRNTSEWRRPPTYPEYADRYRSRAIILFAAKYEAEVIMGGYTRKLNRYQGDFLPARMAKYDTSLRGDHGYLSYQWTVTHGILPTKY